MRSKNAIASTATWYSSRHYRILITTSDVVVHTIMKVAKKIGNRNFTILVEEETDGGFTGRRPELRRAVSYGKIMKELKDNMKNAITIILDVLEVK